MTTKQQRAYRAEWKKAAAALRSTGLSQIEIEEKRRDITAAVRRDAKRTTTGMRNGEYDQLLVLVRALYTTPDPALAIRQLEQPKTRIIWLVHHTLDQIVAMLETNMREHEAEIYQPGQPRDAFILSMGRRLSKDPEATIDYFDETTWSKLLASLRYRFDQVARKGPGRPTYHGERPRLNRPAEHVPDCPF